MTVLKSRHLFTLDIALHPTLELGLTPVGERRVFPVAGGRFDGERLRGQVSPFAGSDLLLIRADGSREQDVRLLLNTDDGAQIIMTYRGRGHSSPEVAARVASGEMVEPSEYYLRTAPFFETGSATYHWLNLIAAIGVGERRADGSVRYEVHEVL
jgi:hypothetical protein